LSKEKHNAMADKGHKKANYCLCFEFKIDGFNTMPVEAVQDLIVVCFLILLSFAGLVNASL
jgi:hypothetical protein